MCTGADDMSMRCRVCRQFMSKTIVPLKGHIENGIQCGATEEQLANSTMQSCHVIVKSISQNDWWCHDFADDLALSLSTATKSTNLTAICEKHGQSSGE